MTNYTYIQVLCSSSISSTSVSFHVKRGEKKIIWPQQLPYVNTNTHSLISINIFLNT